MKHAILSPSAAHRWLRCPGSASANRDKPYEQNKYALEGTSAHGLLETCLRLHTGPEHFLGTVLQAGHMPVDESMVDNVGFALDYTYAYLANNPGTQIRIEHPVFPGALLGLSEEIVWGTPDIQLDNYPKELVTIDYKHGVGIAVAVRDNPQIKLYHAGGRQHRGKYRSYRSVVVQPRAPRRRPVQEHALTDAELVGWLDTEVRPAVSQALSQDAPRVAGEWCKYCAASGACPAQLEAAFDKAAKEFGKVAKTYSPAQLARYLDMIPMLETAIEDLRGRAISAVHAGEEIPGYEKAWTQTRRVWKDETEANALLEKLGLGLKERYEVSLLSPAKAEKALRAKGLMPRAKRGQDAPPSPLEKVVTQSEPSPTIQKTRGV